MDHERIIHIYDYLSRYTDENHYVSISQIQDHLANTFNLTRVKNVTIRRDLDRLTAMGNNIVKHNREHNTAYYALIDKGFSFNEIRFIVDSISINKFLTAFQKQTLIKKFEGMCSDAEIRQLISRIVLNERCPSTLDLLENLDNEKERLFCVIAYLPKATVQAAIGSVPLSLGLPCGKIVLSVAVLAILITAPLGAIGIDRTHKALIGGEKQ